MNKNELDLFVSENWNRINLYLDKYKKQLPLPLYTSVDIRESTLKYAPVDNNIYPAGFNNLCMLDQEKASETFLEYLQTKNMKGKRIGILCESHTKNLFYLDHLAILGKTLRDAGYDTCTISFESELFGENSSLSLISHSKFPVEILKAQSQDGLISTLEGELDFVVLNNDQSAPIDLDWSSLKTPVEPPPAMGWHRREKLKHFSYYHDVLEDFEKEFKVPTKLLEASFKAVHDVDFASKEGLEAVARAVDEIKSQDPQMEKIFVKANQGTYGMGISVVGSGAEIIEMNRKSRNKMDIGKNRKKFTSVLVQEGVRTILQYDGGPAEVTIYLVKGCPVGGFMRTNPLRDAESNLNSRGMVFKKFCISEIRQSHDDKAKEATYSIIARLSTIASGYEIKEIL